MNGEVEELLKKYGTSLEETRKLMPELTETIKRRHELKPPAWPAVTQFFTAEEVKEMGLITEAGEPFELELGWRLKVVPPVDGQEPKFSYITPEDWEITQEGIYISPEGKRFTREEIEAMLAPPEVPIEAEVGVPVAAPKPLLALEQVFGRAFPEYKWMTSDIEQTLTWLTASEENLGEFLNLIRTVGRDEDTEALLKMMFPEITPEQIATVFGEVAEEEPFIPGTRITPEGLEFVIEVEEKGVPVRKLALLKPDATIWMEGKHVGTLNPETGMIEPERAWWEFALMGLEWAFAPFALFGQAMFGPLEKEEILTREEELLGPEFMAEMADIKAKIADVNVPPEERLRLTGRLLEMERVRARTMGKTALPGGEAYREYRDKPFWQQLLAELPMWIAAGRVTLRGIRAALAPAAAKPGLAAIPPTVARGALYPFAQLERLLGYVPGKALQRIAKRQWTKQQAAQWAALETNVQKIVLVELDAILKASPELALRATPQTLSKIAYGMGQILRAAPAAARGRPTYGVIGEFASEQLGRESARKAARVYARFILELASPVKPKFAIEALTKAGFSPEAIQKMSLETVEKSIIGALGEKGALIALLKSYTPEDKELITLIEAIPEVMPPEVVTPKAVVPKPEVPPAVVPKAVPEIELYKTTRGFEEDAALRADLETVQGYKLHAVFKTPGDAQTAAAELVGQDIKFVKHISTTGVETWEVYAKPAVEEVTIAEVEEVSLRISEMSMEVAGLKEWLATEPAAKLVDLIKKTGWYKGEVSNLTIAQYKKLTGKAPLANILTADKKYVRWEYALDEVATEMGYESGDVLKAEIERAGETMIRIKELQAEIAVTEVPVVTPKAVVPVPKPTMIQELGQIYSEIEIEVKATQAAVKGLKGEEARIARETLKGMGRELTYVKTTLENFRQRPDLPEATVLRSTIMAWAKMKGLPKTQTQEIFRDIAGKRQLRLIPQEQLVKILDAVKAARPKTIRGKTVVTAKTEKKIQTLKDTLIANKQLTEKGFKHLQEQLGLTTDRYESQYRFITESEAKSLIRAMNDEAVLAEWSIKVEESLARHPDIKTAWDDLNARSIKEKEVTFDGKPIEIRRGNELRSMRYYVLKLQKELDAPIYDVWQKINMAHLALRLKQDLLYEKLVQSTPAFKHLKNDEAALKRIEDWIAAKHKMATIKSPADITAEEIKLAQEIEQQLFQFRNDVRYARFMEAYAGHGGDTAAIKLDIPDAPGRALRRAIDIYEGKGAEALRVFLDTQDWGVIRTGYDPRSIVKPKLHLYPAKPTTFAKGHIQTRSGIEYYAEDRDILSRYRSYTKQMMGLTDLAPLVRAFDRVFTEHAGKLEPGTMREVARALSRGMNEMKGYREDGGFILHIIERNYALVATTVFWRPDLVLRNKFQNFAFNSDYWAGRFMDLRNKALTDARRLWFETFVAQQRGVTQDLLLYQEQPLPGTGRVLRLARRTSLYPWSDKSNRAECFMVRINRVDRALEAYEKHGDINKLIKDCGLFEFEPRQQAEALELLAMDSVDYGIEGMIPVSGKEAFALYNAQQLTNNVHFLYDRAQRAPAEMGAAGKTLGNILVFNRSWGERLLLQANKLADPKASMREKIHALKIIIGIIVAGLIAGEAYKRVTGKTHNPYNPLNILTWTPGGLAMGVVEDISNTIYWMTEAVQGDRNALGKLPSLISGCATLCLPFYRNFILAVDTITDMKNVDVWAMRKIREMIDDEYEVRGGTHEVERTLLEKFQHALLAGKDEPVTTQEKLAEAEEMLGQVIVEDMPFSIEEPDIYNMKDLNTVMGRNLKDIPLEDITKANDYSDLAWAWKAKENMKDVYDRLPDRPLYQIEDFEELYAQWRLVKDDPDWEKDYPKANLGNFTKRQLDLLRQYHSLDKAEQAEFLEKHPELKLNPANEWLKAHPKENAQLAIWGQAKILSLEAYNEFNKLVDELDIPNDAIPELTLPPEGSVENYFKYLETGGELGYNSWEVQLIIAQDDDLREFLERQPIETPVESLELKVKHRELFDLYDAYSDKDSPLYIEDDDARDEARDKLKADNPEWADDMRRIEAIEHGAPDDVIEEWVERGQIVDEFNAGSSEAMVWLIDHPEAFQWALDQELLTDDGSDWNVPVIRINAKWRTEDGEYDALETTEERLAYLVDNEEYRKDRRRRDAYGMDFPDTQIENYVAYYELPAKGFRQERFLLENKEFAKAMHEIAGMDLPDPKKVPAVGWDETYEKWQDSFDKLWGLADHESEHYIEDVNQRAAERYKMRYDARGNPTEFYKAEKRLDAYSFFVPENLVDTFVEYYTSSNLKKPVDWKYDLWYEDDWFLMEHPRFYQTMLDLKIWLEPWDFSKVPTRAVFDLYKTYLGLPSGKPRYDFRAKHLDLDAWLVLKFGYKPISERGEEGAEKTPWEEAEEAERFKELF